MTALYSSERLWARVGFASVLVTMIVGLAMSAPCWLVVVSTQLLAGFIVLYTHHSLKLFLFKSPMLFFFVAFGGGIISLGYLLVKTMRNPD